MSHYAGEIPVTESNNEIDTYNSDDREIYIKKIKTNPFGLLDVSMSIWAILVYCGDVGSDIYLAYQYYSLKRWYAFGFTAAFVVIPLIVINLISLYWHISDENALRSQGVPNTKGLFWYLRAILTFPLMMGAVVRRIQSFYHGWKSRSVDCNQQMLDQYKAMLCERTRAGKMGMFEAVLESAPQLSLQMYLMLTESTNLTDDVETSNIRIPSMFLSWIGASCSLTTSYTALKAEIDLYVKKEIRLSKCATAFYFVWRLCEIGPRMVVLALFASLFQWYTFIVVGVHWALALLGMVLQKVCDKHHISTNLIFSLVLIFSFQNVRGGRSRYKALLYYCVFYTENLVMLVLWLCYTSHKGDGYYIAAIVVVPMGMILHIIFQVLYYKRCHPKKDDIESCFHSLSPWGCTSCCLAQPERSRQESSTTEQYPLHVLPVPNLEVVQTEK